MSRSRPNLIDVLQIAKKLAAPPPFFLGGGGGGQKNLQVITMCLSITRYSETFNAPPP